MRLLTTLLLTIAVLLCGCKKEEPEDLLKYINPMLGTKYFGHTYPGAALPFAMIHVSPDTHNEGWAYSAGYAYGDTSIMGFSHTHWSGGDAASGGDILLMPVVNQTLQIVPGSKENPDEGYRSRFRHETEHASPGYYAVHLDDYHITVQLTTTPRVALHRYTFPRSNSSRILLDLGHQLGISLPHRRNELTIVDDQTIEGSRSSKMGRVYFVMQWSKPCKYYGTFDASLKSSESGAGIFPYKSRETGDKIGAFLEFDTDSLEQISAKVAISYVSIEGARENMEAELDHWSFHQTLAEARTDWRNAIERIKIDDPNPANKEKFYSALYHSLLAQYIAQDVDGQYFGMNNAVNIASGRNHIGSFSGRDIYQSQYPLLTLVAPDHQSDILTSIQDKIRDFGWHSSQHAQNELNTTTASDPLIPIVVDAYMKGYRHFDEEAVYNAMRTKAMELTDYTVLGYAPVDKINESVSNTLELAYNDWCIAQMAKAMGKDADYNYFKTRSKNYANLWDNETQFMRPRNSNGKFLELRGERRQVILKQGNHTWYGYFDPLWVGRQPNRAYTESNAWQSLWSVQHDPDGLIQLFGSKEAFVTKLDSFFSISSSITGPKYIGTVGTIGQYSHANPYSRHAAYFYNVAGEPWKTQYWSRYICRTLYRTGAGGLCGNDNMGSLSSWYALSAMGIYSFTPGQPTYQIGSPAFSRSTIQVANGKQFEIIAHNNSEQNIYIQSAKLNEQPFNRTHITHEEIQRGGRLEFVMGPSPNKRWGIE